MKLYTGYRSTPGRQLAGVPFIPTVGVKDLPERVNWKEKGWLTGVKNQVSSEHLTHIVDLSHLLGSLITGAVWWMLGVQCHRISGGTAFQKNRETSLSLRTESN